MKRFFAWMMIFAVSLSVEWDIGLFSCCGEEADLFCLQKGGQAREKWKCGSRPTGDLGLTVGALLSGSVADCRQYTFPPFIRLL